MYQFTPDTILIISGALVFSAFILGVIYITRIQVVPIRLGRNCL
jgi:hypothetical protein